MKTIMSRSSHESSFSFSRRYFNWGKKVEDEDNDQETLTFSSSSHFFEEGRQNEPKISLPNEPFPATAPRKKRHQMVSVSKLKSVLTIFGKNQTDHLGTKVIGTLFGRRRGHVHFAFQEDIKSNPRLLIELAIPTSILIREMASGIVRVALECEKKREKKSVKLLEEPSWRTYCNGRKCGLGLRRERGPEDLKILKAVKPISVGAGVLPGNGDEEGDGSEGEVMYMRAKFERVIGSKDSEAFYMSHPDGTGGPELSIFLIRV